MRAWSAITTKVKAAILKDPALKTLQISVKTYKGVVQLSGFVDSKEMVDRAERWRARSRVSAT